jgi:tRNA A-37 threonylcarbamoyl transferase component Bud32
MDFIRGNYISMQQQEEISPEITNEINHVIKKFHSKGFRFGDNIEFIVDSKGKVVVIDLDSVKCSNKK